MVWCKHEHEHVQEAQCNRCQDTHATEALQACRIITVVVLLTHVGCTGRSECLRIKIDAVCECAYLLHSVESQHVEPAAASVDMHSITE